MIKSHYSIWAELKISSTVDSSGKVDHDTGISHVSIDWLLHDLLDLMVSSSTSSNYMEIFPYSLLIPCSIVPLDYYVHIYSATLYSSSLRLLVARYTIDAVI
ncbi:hypothetical protein VTO42DRAFT_1639 [Malbranchea cinnamomea]